MTDWIPVTERLPEKNVMVLVYEPSFAATDEHNAKYWEGSIKRPFGVRFGSVSPVGFRPEGCNGNYDITHWMPLPEPPES